MLEGTGWKVKEYILRKFTLHSVNRKNFLHLSDIHIPDKKGDLWDAVDPCLKLEKLIELAEKLDLNPSFTS